MGLTGSLALLVVVQLSLAQGTSSNAASLGAAPKSLVQSVSPTRQLTSTPWTLRIGPQRPDLVRYNRVEALSLGVRAQVRPGTPIGPLSFSGTARFGLGDKHPNGRLEIVHESLDRRIALSGYHELAAIDERARHFGVANSLTGLLWGHDDGDYYRRSGATLEWTPPTFRPRTVRYRAFAEYHERVENGTDVQLPRLWDESASFRPNILAYEGWMYGASMEWTARFGTDPGRTSGGGQTLLEFAEGGSSYLRYSVGADVAFALPARMRLVFETEAGSSEGAPAQKLWYLGGPLTMRGYSPRAAGGESFGRGRVELDRSFSFGRLVLFSDVGWAGDGSDIDLDTALYSVGAGLAVIDGILRIDGAWQLKSLHRFRLDVYLDQLL